MVIQSLNSVPGERATHSYLAECQILLPFVWWGIFAKKMAQAARISLLIKFFIEHSNLKPKYFVKVMEGG